MVDFALPAEYPYKDQGVSGAEPLNADDYNAVLAALVDLGGASGRVKALELPEQAAAAAVTASTLLSKTTRFDSTGAAIPQSLPPAVAGARLAVGWDKGANAVTISGALRTDTCGTTSGSATVTDATIVAADAGRVVTGAGVPASTYVGQTITPGVSFKLSSSPTTQVDVTATATAASVSLTVQDRFGSGATTSFPLAFVGESRTLHCTTPGCWRETGKVIPASALPFTSANTDLTSAAPGKVVAVSATSPLAFTLQTASGATTFTQSATKTAAYTAAANEIAPLDTTGGTFTLTGPASGAPFGARWKAGTAAPTVAAPSGYTINGAASLVMGLAPGTSAGELIVWQAFGTDYQPVGGFKPQSALDLKFAPVEIVVRGTGIDPTGAVDSYAAIQAVITAAPEGARVRFPTGVFRLSDTLVVNKHLTICGTAMSPNFIPVSEGGSLDLPYPTGNYSRGTTLVQVGTSKDCFSLTRGGSSVNLEDFFIWMAAATTGHGIVAIPNETISDGHDMGLASFTWRNLGVYGHGGNKYGYYLVNPIHGRMDNLSSWGGGGFRIEGDTITHYGNYGNLLITDAFVEMYNSGTAHGYDLRAARTAGLNLVSMIRAQCNCVDPAAAAGTQALFTVTRGAGTVHTVTLIDPDFEVFSGTCTIELGGATNTQVKVYGGLLARMPVNGYNDGTRHGYQLFSTSGTFTVPWNVTKVRARPVGGGGGGGGGGSAASGSGQIGGGGGGAGLAVDVELTVTPGSTITVTCGAGGTSGTAGASGGNAGGTGGNGGSSQFGSISAAGGGGGAGASVTTTGGAAGGYYGRTSWSQVIGVPGHGGLSGTASWGLSNGGHAVPISPGLSGGGGGGIASATLGGTAGQAANAFPATVGQAGGVTGAAATAAGQAGSNAGPGNGGGGGGGGAPGGAGGAGGTGGVGQVEVWW